MKSFQKLVSMICESTIGREKKTVVEQHIMKAGNVNYPEAPEWHE